jgi:hypothetical protein
MAAALTMIGTVSASAEPTLGAQGAAVVGIGTYYPNSTFDINAQADKFTRRAEGSVVIDNGNAGGRLVGVVTCVATRLRGDATKRGEATVSGFASTGSTVSQPGFILYAKDDDALAGYDYLELNLTSEIPTPGECTDPPSPASTPVISGDVTVYPCKKLK